MDQVNQYQTCRRCGWPYPTFEGGTDPGLCPPCRKHARARARGVAPELTASDRAYVVIHSFYRKKAAEEARTVTNENINLRATVARLRGAVARLEEEVAPMAMMWAAAEEAARKINNLRTRLRESDALINDLRMSLRMADQAAARRAILGTRVMNLKTALPDGVTVTDLIKLCHPDRHASGTMASVANEVTKWLITKR